MTHLVDARGLSEEEMRRLHALLGERLDGDARSSAAQGDGDGGSGGGGDGEARHTRADGAR